MSEPRNPTHKPDSHKPDSRKPDSHKPSNRKLGERLARSLTPQSSLDQLPLGQLPRGQLPTVDLDDCGSCRPMRRIAILLDCYTERARARNKALDRSARSGVFDLRLSQILALGPCKNSSFSQGKFKCAASLEGCGRPNHPACRSNNSEP